jgi:spore coat polysaccharide biosynthesis protein SpsF (cytidylyltransferase family)
MIIEKQPNGSLLITDIIHSQFIKKVYYFTSIKEAKKDFRKHCNEVANNWLEYLAK